MASPLSATTPTGFGTTFPSTVMLSAFKPILRGDVPLPAAPPELAAPTFEYKA